METLFPYKQRGGTTGGEIAAGICMGLLSVCGIFMNLQLLAQYQISGPAAAAAAAYMAANGEIFAQMYFVSMLVSFAGSLLIGLVAKLPLVQVSSLGLSAVLVSLVGIGTGLSYYKPAVPLPGQQRDLRSHSGHSRRLRPAGGGPACPVCARHCPLLLVCCWPGWLRSSAACSRPRHRPFRSTAQVLCWKPVRPMWH